MSTDTAATIVMLAGALGVACYAFITDNLGWLLLAGWMARSAFVETK